MQIFYIDLFSGAGGTTTGIHMAGQKVVACVNHDINAIESHKANHPECIHFTEDVRDIKVVVALKKLVKQLRSDHTGCVICIWASLECTNYSKAKGGLPRDADSRTLANSLFMYLEHLSPDYLDIENVREFMSWGPLDENGKPISKLNGRDYIAWTKKIQSYGYDFDWGILNAANYGAYTSRERYFAQFAKSGLPIRWPEQTHSKDPGTGTMFQPLKKWKPVREVLDMEDEGESIFTRKKPLVDKTLERIYAGLVKFVAGGEVAFLKKYYSGRPMGKVISVNGPCGTVTTVDHHHLVQPCFLLKYNSMNKNGKYQAPGINEPCPVVSTQGRLGIVNPSFLTSYYGNTKDAHSDQIPCPTVTTKDRFNKIQPQFLTHYYSGGGQVSDLNNPAPVLTGIPKARLTSCQFIDQQYGQSKPSNPDEPAGSITANPKLALVQSWMLDTNYNNVGKSIDEPAPTILACRKHHYLLNPQYNNKGGSVDKPCFTLIARMDKRPPHIVQVDHGAVTVIIYDTDSEIMRKIKEFMALYSVVDIKMRMLKIPELLRIQGFPDGYVLKGTQTEQKKYIGNAVVTIMAKALVRVNADALLRRKEDVSA